jgi:hypothetical protein
MKPKKLNPLLAERNTGSSVGSVATDNGPLTTNYLFILVRQDLQD